ncbi:hypothetical protein ACSBR1_003979 [Camellia fascicularis]
MVIARDCDCDCDCDGDGDGDGQCEFCFVEFHLRAKCIDDQTLDVTSKDLYSSDHTVVPIDFSDSSSGFDNAEHRSSISYSLDTGKGPQFLILLIQAKVLDPKTLLPFTLKLNT